MITRMQCCFHILCSLDPKKLTFLLTHGYLEHGNKKWIRCKEYKNDKDQEMDDVRKMRDALLKQGDHNVIILDWLNASGPPYTQVIWIRYVRYYTEC